MSSLWQGVTASHSVWLSPTIGDITESILFVQTLPPRRSKLFPSPKLLGYASASFAQGENGRGMSGGHAESLTAVNIHEVQNIIVWYRTMLSLYSRIPAWWAWSDRPSNTRGSLGSSSWGTTSPSVLPTESRRMCACQRHHSQIDGEDHDVVPHLSGSTAPGARGHLCA